MWKNSLNTDCRNSHLLYSYWKGAQNFSVASETTLSRLAYLKVHDYTFDIGACINPHLHSITGQRFGLYLKPSANVFSRRHWIGLVHAGRA